MSAVIFALLLAAIVVLGVVLRRWAVLAVPFVVWPIYFAASERGEHWGLLLALTLAASVLLTALGVAIARRLREPDSTGHASS